MDIQMVDSLVMSQGDTAFTGQCSHLCVYCVGCQQDNWEEEGGI